MCNRFHLYYWGAPLLEHTKMNCEKFFLNLTKCLIFRAQIITTDIKITFS